MTIYDSELAEIIKSQTPVEINGLQYIIEPNRSGSCDGCAFIGQWQMSTKSSNLLLLKWWKYTSKSKLNKE